MSSVLTTLSASGGAEAVSSVLTTFTASGGAEVVSAGGRITGHRRREVALVCEGRGDPPLLLRWTKSGDPLTLGHRSLGETH